MSSSFAAFVSEFILVQGRLCVSVSLKSLRRVEPASPKLCAHLDLRHGWPTFPDTTAPQVDAATTSTKEGEEQAHGVRGKAKPEECGDCLSFLAALVCVVRSVGDLVAVSVGLDGD